jgi:hypothetical protein
VLTSFVKRAWPEDYDQFMIEGASGSRKVSRQSGVAPSARGRAMRAPVRVAADSAADRGRHTPVAGVRKSRHAQSIRFGQGLFERGGRNAVSRYRLISDL